MDFKIPITEEDLRAGTIAFKEQRDFRGLKEFLIQAITAGQMTSPLQSRAYNELGLAHLQLEEPQEADKAFLSAIERDERAINPRFNRANLYLTAQDHEGALAMFQEILKMDEKHVGARFHAGLCLAQQDEKTLALAYFLESAQAAPDAMGPQFWTAESFLARREFAEALPYFTRALELTPGHNESLRGSAICLLHLKRLEECVEICDQLIGSGGGAEFIAWQVKGDALLKMGQTANAAVCHLMLAELDFDAREYVIQVRNKLEEEDPVQGKLYREIVQDRFRELDDEFLGLDELRTQDVDEALRGM